MRVSLFITCLVDQFHPEVGVAMVTVLRRLGVTCTFPSGQTCCGQPALNSGFPHEARAAARQFIAAFAGADLIVTPSGSCATMLVRHLSELFPSESLEARAAEAIGRRVREFSQFLVRDLAVTDVGARLAGRVAYHDSCHLLRDLGIRSEPRQLLLRVRDLELVSLPGSEDCCGFGGTFAAKYPELSQAIGNAKLANLRRSGANYVVANETGCLMHLRGLLARQQIEIRALHLAEVLASGLSDEGAASPA